MLLFFVLASVALIVSGCVGSRLAPAQARRGGATAGPALAPQVEISPAEGGAGTRIVVEGRHWTPGGTIFVRLEDPVTGRTPGLDQGSALAGDNGEFSVKFTYPFDPRWLSEPEVAIAVMDPVNGQRVSTSFRIVGAAAKLTGTTAPTPGVVAVAPTTQSLPTLTLPTQGPPTVVPPSATPLPALPTLVLPSATPLPAPVVAAPTSVGVPTRVGVPTSVGPAPEASGAALVAATTPAELCGQIEQLPASGIVGNWRVGGRTVRVTDATRTDALEGRIELGWYSRIRGSLQPEGSLDAFQIQVRKTDNNDRCTPGILLGRWSPDGKDDRGEGRNDTELEGNVERLPAGGLVGIWVIDGRPVVVGPSTKIKTESKAGAVQLGTRVKVKGSIAADGRYLAAEIKRKK